MVVELILQQLLGMQVIAAEAKENDKYEVREDRRGKVREVRDFSVALLT
jgi:hypothetical protein